MKAPLLSIIVVSFNTSELTLATIHSVLDSAAKDKLKPTEVEIIVVDNNSTDSSVTDLKKTFGAKIHLIENQTNSGFAKANNQGAKVATGEYLLLLNSDTFIHPGALKSLISQVHEDPKIGIIAASLKNPDGSYQPQGGSLPRLRNVTAWWLWPFPGVFPGVEPYQDPRPIGSKGFVPRGWVGGTALMMRRKVYLAVGGLDERIFMYAEDVDLCLRVARFGLKVGILSEAHITHLGSASSSSSRARLGEVKGILYVFKKHKPSWELPILRAVLVKGAILRLLYFGILKRSREAIGLYARAVAAALS